MPARRSFFQTAWVVDDIHDAIGRWAVGASVGPFFLLPDLSVERARYRGRPTDLVTHLAIAQVGTMQIELIQPVSTGPSVYRDSVPPGTEALHHIAAFTDDFDAELAHFAGAGVDLAFEGVFGDMRFGYFDTRATIGCMTELLEREASVEGLFATIAEAGANWDGTDPIRGFPG